MSVAEHWYYRGYERLPVAQKPIIYVLIWALTSATANLAWEVAQLPLYTLFDEPDTGKIILYVLHCTVGDMLIALCAYALSSLVLHESAWPLRDPWRGMMIASAFGLAYTAASEWYNVYRSASWAYNESMPLVFGIGLSPVLQWLLIPPFVLLIVRRTAKKDLH